MSDVDVPPSVWRAFVQVARLRSFSKAARTLQTRQSTVSTQIKRLEEQIAQPLFARSTRRVALTPLAERLLPVAEEIISLQTVAAARLLDAPLAGVVTFAASEPLFTIYEIDRLLARFARTHPEIVLQAEIVPDRQIADVLAARGHDLVLAACAGDGYDSRAMRRERLLWVSGRGVELRDGRVPERRIPIVLVPPFTDALAARLLPDGPLRATLTVPSADAAIRAVRAGLGVTLVPASESARLDLAPADPANLPAQPALNVVLHSRSPLPGAATALRNQILHWMQTRRRVAEATD